ncbi:MAG: nucleotide exchange factor GrpE [Bacteroidota bacterium]
MNEEIKDSVENNGNQQTTNTEDNSATTNESNPLVEKIVLLEKQVEEQKDKYLRLFSDFDNYKKRSARERNDTIQSAGKEIMSALIPVADDMERAMKAFKESQDIESIKAGLELVYTKFVSTLENKGLKGFDAIGEIFDVEKHEAITEIPAPNEEMKGKVIDQVEKGYYLNEKIVRYAKVVVGK